MKPIAATDRRIANIYESAFTAIVNPDGQALGNTILQLDETQPLGNGFFVYRMPAGMTTRGHRHNGNEQFLILEGELIDNDGTVYRNGDMVFYRDGSEHNSHTPNGCLLAVHIDGPEFILE